VIGRPRRAGASVERGKGTGAFILTAADAVREQVAAGGPALAALDTLLAAIGA
jgi:hypothetical protein